MKAFVLVSEVIDMSFNQTVDEQACSLWGKSILKVPNYADLVSLEIMAQLKKGPDVVESVTVGQESTIFSLKTFVAPKVNKANIILDNDIKKHNSHYISEVVRSYLHDKNVELILCGGETSDFGSGLTGPLLARCLGIDFLGSIVNILNIDENTKTICVKRKLDWGKREVLIVPYPIVLGVVPGEVLPSMSTLEQKLRGTIETIDVGSLTLNNPDKIKQGAREVFKANPRGVFTPDDSLSPAEKIKALMSGGVSKKSRGDVLEGREEGLAEQIVEYLREIQIL
ncbi:electron transfer flavoprotein beta subunit [Geothermobacter ehrlichii]|uniref:Electron transfer flavoprotein beta subunit n=1 Tax=Geothermobacter ehrlichii TaxID=213224 RepID=A0A5D3WHT8_9BACT|nr:hypothetical protein [Geothermobacter ehrlichii]TYO98435.1 electron transfer flavoprotein beta subunit [Geothermobacter ehrlichii]